MLNINPINHNTNINFKSKRDYSRLYKEMEKISLTREEKIKPKVKFSDIVNNIKSKYRDKMSDARYKMYDAIDEMEYYLQKLKKKMNHIKNHIIYRELGLFDFMGAIAVILLGGIGIPLAIHYKLRHNEVNSITQHEIDSLINLYQNKTISIEEFQKKYNELNKKD